MSKRAALYLRVSTDNQSTDNQRRELEAVAARAGWTIACVLEDAGLSGAKGRDRRPAFDRLHRMITRREVDLVMAWSVDRLGRSLQDLVAFLGELHGAGCDLYLHAQGLDTSTPAGKAMFGMLGVFAEFERSMIQERVRAGLARAKAQGKHLGRPRVAAELEAKVATSLREGLGIHRTARLHGVGTSTVQRIRAGTSPAG